MSTDNIQRTKRIAVVRIRGTVDTGYNVKRTMELLRLNRNNHCVIIDDRPTFTGMLQHAKDFITWGEVNEEAVKKLIEKRGRLAGNLRIDNDYVKNNSDFNSVDEFINKFLKFEAEISDIKDLKPVFRLHPPLKGYRGRGVKRSYSDGGNTGYRGEEINILLQSMS